MNAAQQFPFALEPNAIDEWLATINLSDTVQLSHELHQIVKDLNHASIDKHLLFEIINKLTPVIVNLSSELEQKFFSEIHPLDAKTYKLGRLNLHLYRELVTAYHKIATDDDTNQQLHCVHCALQFIGQHLLLSAKISVKQSNFCWKMSAQLYQLAKQQDILSSPVKEKARANTSTINLLKRNLLFSICNPYQFNCTDIDSLYTFLTTHCHLTDLEEAAPRTTEKFCFVWKYNSSRAPSPALHGKLYHSSVLLKTTRLTSHVQSSKFKPPFAAFNDVQLRLSGYQKVIQSDIPSIPKVCLLFFGFDQVAEALQQQTRKNKILQHTKDFRVSNALKNAKLEPLDHERSFVPLNKNDINDNDDTQKINTVKILKTQHSGYIIAISQPANYTIDSLVIVVNEDNSPDIGIIRKILNITQSNTQRVLIELIPGDSYCSEVLDTKFAGKAIIMTGAAESVEVLLTPKSYITGSKLQVGKTQLKLEKLTELTPHFMRYQATTII